jgi:hypothetical protein
MFNVEGVPWAREQVLAAIALEPVDVAVARHAAKAHEALALAAWAHFRFVVAKVEGIGHDDTSPEQLTYLGRLHADSRFGRGVVMVMCRNRTRHVSGTRSGRGRGRSQRVVGRRRPGL